MSNGRAARRRLAANDGRTITLDACCRLVITLGPTRIAVAHDDGCAALDPGNPAGYAARVQANQAVTRAVAAYTGTVMTVMVR